MQFEYSFGLALEGVIPSYDSGNELKTLEFRLVFRNVSDGPMAVQVDKFIVKIADRFCESETCKMTIPRSSSITIFPSAGFSNEAFRAFPDRVSGSIEYEATYGHPESLPVRRAHKMLHANLFINRDASGIQSVRANWVVSEESDMPI
ncbi:MAG: hypothetical protein NVV74_19190 [Magnetospirillum sp.]|nr:hypothetical protein [Magnetospirillum sp.]